MIIRSRGCKKSGKSFRLDEEKRIYEMFFISSRAKVWVDGLSLGKKTKEYEWSK